MILLLFLNLLNAFGSSGGENPGAEQFQFFKDYKTYIKEPFQLRDPFKRKLVKRKTLKKIEGTFLRDGNVFTNMPDISNVKLDQIKIVGVLLGKERRALAKVKGQANLSDHTFILKEGMTLGLDKAELKAILPGGIVLVEKIKNVYDEDEYLETVIPVSTD